MLRRWLRAIHVLHTWGETQQYHTNCFTMIGLFWGWSHRYQQCERCNARRLIEGFLDGQGYYLRPGFTSEDQ